MTVNRVLAVDIGTSAMKGAVVDRGGNLLSWGRVPLISGPRADFSAWDPGTWRRGLSRLVEIIRGTAAALEVDAVSISGNGPTLVPIAADGETAGDALLWLDGREKRRPEQKSFFLPKAAWLAERHPEIYERTVCFIPCPEYAAYLLCGEAAAVSPSREFSEYFWSPGSISAYGLDPEKFPPIVRPGEIIGEVTAGAGREFGMPSGIPVIGAGSDFLMALLGTGAVVPGTTCDRAGTSEGINYCSAVKVTDRRLRCLPHAVEGLYNVAGILSSTGRVFEWFREISNQGNVGYEEMLADIASLDHDARRPSFFPSVHRGATWEFSGGIFIELEPENGPREMGRSVVESIGFAVRDLVETLGETGCTVTELRISGGQGRNAAWNQMKADITGVGVAVPKIIDAELLGNACAAFVASGEFSTLREASLELVRIERIFEPDPSVHDRFTESYRRYRELCSTVIDALADYRNRARSVE